MASRTTVGFRGSLPTVSIVTPRKVMVPGTHQGVALKTGILWFAVYLLMTKPAVGILGGGLFFMVSAEF